MEKEIKKILHSLNKKEFYFVYFIICVVIILSFFRIHGSSIGMYHIFFYGSSVKDKNLLFSLPNPIRGDEWLVSTPYTVSQWHNEFRHRNMDIGLGQEMSILYDTPTNHWSTFFKPYNWSFFIMPLENAFAFKWWIKGALLLIGLYALIYYITKKMTYAITFPFILFFSPFIQWWYSTSLTEVIAYGILSLFFFIYGCLARKTINTIIHSIGFIFFSIAFIFTFYPPFQISIGLLLISLAGGFIAKNYNYLRKTYKSLLLRLGISFAIIIACTAIYFANFWSIIQVIQNTVYPGRRVIEGGGYQIINLFSGFYDLQLLHTGIKVPNIVAENHSEASNFIILFPYFLPVLLFFATKQLINRKKIDYMLIGIILYTLFILSWLFIGLPDALSYAFLLTKVPYQRLIAGIGFANILLMLYMLTFKSMPKTLNYKIIAGCIASIGLVSILFVGSYFQSFYPQYLNNTQLIFTISFVAFILIFLMLLQKAKLFIIAMLIFSIYSTLKVNPLYVGLDPLIRSDISNIVRKIEMENYKKYRWVVYDNPLFADYIIANGANVINGDHFYPQFDLWKKFDKESKYTDLYNRYAHVIFTENKGESIDLVLNRYEFFTVHINPCNTVMKQLRIKYYVFLQEKKFDCLKLTSRTNLPRLKLYVYQRYDL